MLVFLSQSTYGQDPNEPNTAQIQKKQYQCKKHSEINNGWHTRCPVCGREIIPERPPMRMMPCWRCPACGMHYPGMHREPERYYERRTCRTPKLSKSENMLHKIMLNTPIDVFDPEVILGTEKPLKQQSDLDSLAKSTNKIKTMAQMQHQMRYTMQSSRDMMNPNMKPQKFKPAVEPQAKPADPKPADPKPAREIMQGDLNFNSDITPGQFNDRAQGDFGGSMRDSQRDNFRDNLRDRYRDHYRDQYRDRLRDNLRDEYFYNPYDYGFYSYNYGYNPYDYGYYGYSPYYYEPYYGYNDFYNDEGGFGDDEGGTGDDEGGFGDNEGFGGDESGFGDDEEDGSGNSR